MARRPCRCGGRSSDGRVSLQHASGAFPCSFAAHPPGNPFSRRRTMDHAGERLRRDALQRPVANHCQNAARLRPVWSFSTGVLGGHEGQPLVVGSTMYVVTPFPDVLYAFDLTREGYPLKWKYRPEVNPTALGIACCDAINRGRCTRTARSSTTCSTGTPSRSMPSRGASCGRRRSRTCSRARRRQWRRSSQAIA